MIEEKIVLKTLDDVRAFVATASSKEYDIELLCGRYVVNAKSVMGVLSLDLTAPLTMVAHTGGDDELMTAIAPYRAACLIAH